MPRYRTVRGGSYLIPNMLARCAYGYGYHPTTYSTLIGFRLALRKAHSTHKVIP